MKILYLNTDKRAKALGAAEAGYPGPVAIAIAKDSLTEGQKELSLKLKTAGVKPSNCLYYARDNSPEEIELILKAKAAGYSDSDVDNLIDRGFESAAIMFASPMVSVSA